MHRPGTVGVHTYYRDLEFAWDTLYTEKMGPAVQQTLKRWADMLVNDVGISPLAPGARGIEVVHDYLRREGIDWTSVLTQRPLRLGYGSEVSAYTDEDRGHVDVYLTVPNRLYGTFDYDGRYPSYWTAPDEDVTSGYAAGVTRPLNSISLDGPPTGQEVDTLGTGWARPRTSYQTYFHHEFQHSLPPYQGTSLQSELWSAAAEVVGGHHDLNSPDEFPYNFVMPEEYQVRTAFMAYVAYNFLNADTNRTLSGMSDDLLYKWAKARNNGTMGLAGLSQFLSDANCATCAAKQYFRPGGTSLPDYDRLGVLLHNWRVAMFANHPTIEEGQFGFAPWSGFSPAQNVKAWQSFTGTFGDDVDALPNVQTLTSANLSSALTVKHVRSLHGESRPLAVSQYGSNYWVLRAGSGLTSADRKLAVRITPLSALKLENVIPTPSGGRLQVSVIKYSHADTTAAEESILWQHPEWITGVTPITSVDVDSITSEIEIVLPDFGATTKAAVLVLSVSDGRTQRWGNLVDGFTKNALRYRLDFEFRPNSVLQVASRLFSPVDSLRATPSWAPDGNTLVYSAREPSGRARLWRQSLSGGSPIALNSQAMDQLYPDWSPRGDIVAYEAIPNPAIPSETDLYLTPAAPLSGVNPTRLTALSGCEAFPAFQPNGQGLAYLHFNGSTWDLRWVAIDGTGDVLLTNVGIMGGGVNRPRWSPDGSKIYFALQSQGNRIAWVPKSGGTPTLVTDYVIPVKSFDLHPGSGPLAAATLIPLPVTTPSTAPPLGMGWMALFTPDPATRDTAFRLNVLAHDMDSPRYSHDGTRIALQGKRINGVPAMYWGRITDNLPPVFNLIEDQFGTACVPLQFNLPATDPEGQTLTWQAYYKPPGSALIQNNVFRWQYPAVGDYFSVFRVMDSRGAVDSRVVRITITDGGYCEDLLSGGGGGGGGFRSVGATVMTGGPGAASVAPTAVKNSFLDGATDGDWLAQDASLPPLVISASGQYDVTLSSGSPTGADVDRVQLVVVDHSEGTVATAGPTGLMFGRPSAAMMLTLVGDGAAVSLGEAPVQLEPGTVVEATFPVSHEARGIIVTCRQAESSAGAGIEVLTPSGESWNVAGRIRPRRAIDRLSLQGVVSERIRLRFTAPTILAGVQRVLWSPADQSAFMSHEADVIALDGDGSPMDLRVADQVSLHVEPGTPRVLRFAAPADVDGMARDLFLRVTGRISPSANSLRAGEDAIASIPTRAEFGLNRVEPNPSVGHASLAFSIAADGHVEFDVYDIKGARIRSLIRGPLEAGQHQLQWDGRDERGAKVAAGTYFVRLASRERIETRRFVLLQ